MLRTTYKWITSSIFSGSLLAIALFVLGSMDCLAADVQVDSAMEGVIKSLPKGIDVIPAGSVSRYSLGGKHAKQGTMKVVDVTGMPITQALEVHSTKVQSSPWDIQLRLSTSKVVRGEDKVLITFYARATETSTEFGEAVVSVFFEYNTKPWTKSLRQTLHIGKEWKKYYLRFKITPPPGMKEMPAGRCNLAFNLNHSTQTVQFADITCRNYGPGIKLADLPYSKQSYQGMEEDAPWRADAAARIEKYRKSDLVVTVRDAAGKPVPQAKVSVEMIRHAYRFGTAVQGFRLVGARPEDKKYRQAVAKLFNHAVFENDLKWGQWLLSKNNDNPTYRREYTDQAVTWLLDRDFTVSGHILVWPSFRHWVPESVVRLKDDPQALRQGINDYVTDVVSTLKGKAREWIVMNEPYTNQTFMEICGDDVVFDWFKAAHTADPKAELFINDYGIMATGGTTDTAHQADYEKRIRSLLDHKAPLGAIGMECHFGYGVTPPTMVWQILDRYAAFGLPIACTEYDHNTDDAEIQGLYMRDFMIAFFAHPATTGFTVWGLWDGAHWEGNAPIYKKDWTLKPSGKAYQDLVFQQWWTNRKAVTDATGKATVRGFHGKYKITISYAGKEQEVLTDLPKAGRNLTVTLK